MQTRKPEPWIWMLAFLLNCLTMQAQENTPLDARRQSIAGIAALTATGDLEQLNPALHTALDAGLTISQVREVLVHLYAYCGFPRSLNGINTLIKVLEERKAKGIRDQPGKESTVHADAGDKYERGRKRLEELSQTAQPKPAPGYGEFAPRIDAFLKEHLFADVFDSEVLSYAEREIATIAALTALPGLEPQLQSHLRLGANTGLTNSQLLEIGRIARQLTAKTQAAKDRSAMFIRIAEIEIHRPYLTEYLNILKEDAAASVKLEPGVISIFPMFLKNDSTQIRIVEIYADKNAYQHHLTTPHFQKYKTTTLQMVKRLNLVDMTALDTHTMTEIFKKF